MDQGHHGAAKNLEIALEFAGAAEAALGADSPLWALDNVLVSPHTASSVSAENSLITDLFIENLRRWLAGTPLRNVYDRTAGY